MSFDQEADPLYECAKKIESLERNKAILTARITGYEEETKAAREDRDRHLAYAGALEAELRKQRENLHPRQWASIDAVLAKNPSGGGSSERANEGASSSSPPRVSVSRNDAGVAASPSPDGVLTERLFRLLERAEGCVRAMHYRERTEPPYASRDTTEKLLGDIHNALADYQKRHKMGQLPWHPIETAPRDGTLLLLLIAPEGREMALEDTAGFSRAVGHNNLDNDGEDVWMFSGWCWSHDHYTEGHGKPVAWSDLPIVPEIGKLP